MWKQSNFIGWGGGGGALHGKIFDEFALKHKKKSGLQGERWQWSSVIFVGNFMSI